MLYGHLRGWRDWTVLKHNKPSISYLRGVPPSRPKINLLVNMVCEGKHTLTVISVVFGYHQYNAAKT